MLMANKTRTAKRTPFFLASDVKASRCYHSNLFPLQTIKDHSIGVALSSRELRRAIALACRIECSPFERGHARWLFEKMIPCALVWISAAQKLSLSPSHATEPSCTAIAFRLHASNTTERFAP